MPNSPSKFVESVRSGPLLLGVIHLPPLPGSPRYDGAGLNAIVERACSDASVLAASDFDGYVVENFGDAPFFPERVPRHVLTVMTRVITSLPRDGVLVGVNVLRNDAAGALAIAAACDLDFARVNVHIGAAVTDQGVIQGRAAETIRLREQIAPGVAILADVDVKHATPLGSRYDIAAAAKETVARGLADAVVVTGKATGSQTSLGDLEIVASSVPDTPVLAGSGVTLDTLPQVLTSADGVIVGTALKHDCAVEAAIDPDRAREFAQIAHEL